MPSSLRLPWQAALPALLLLAACPTSPPQTPSYEELCGPVDCGAGTCVLDVDGPLCLCDEGHRPEGLRCVEEPAQPPPQDACSPNPCLGLHKGTCTVEGEEAHCSCEPGYVPDGEACRPIPPAECSTHGPEVGGDAQEPDDCFQNAAAPLVPDVPVEGRTLAPAGDVDWYPVPVQAGHVYVLEAEGAEGLALYLDLFAPDGTLPLAADHRGGTTVRLLLRAQQTETLLARLSALSESATGGYTVRLLALAADDFADAPESARLVQPGGVLEGSLSYEGDVDVVALGVNALSSYRFELTPAEGGVGGSALVLELLGPDRRTVLRREVGSSVDIDFHARQAGTHFLRVSSATGQAGADWRLALHALGLDDVADDVADAQPLQAGSTGTLEREGDFDSWSFPVEEGHGYSVSCTAQQATCILQVFDPRGQAITEAGYGYQTQVSFQAAESGRFVVRVGHVSAAGTGTYQLRLVDMGADDHGDGAATATALTPGETAAGSIAFAYDKDAFRFSATAGHIYRATCGGSWDCRLALLGPAGNQLVAPSGSSLLYEAPLSGPHTLLVSFGSDRTGPFTLELVDLGLDDHGDSAPAATPLAVTVGTQQGVLETMGDVDVFRVEGAAGALYRFTCTTSYPVGCAVEARDGAGNLLGQQGQEYSSRVASLTFKLPAEGVAFVHVRVDPYDDEGPYSLRLEAAGEDDHGDSVETATPLALPTLTTASRVDFHGDVDVFSFSASAGHVYRFVCSATQATCQLRLRGPGGAELQTVSGSELRFKTPAAGTYSIWVSASSNTSVKLFDYTHGFEEVGVDDHADALPGATPLAVMEAPAAARLDTGLDADAFVFTPEEGHIYRFSCSPGSASGCAVSVRDRLGQVLRNGVLSSAGDLVVWRAPSALPVTFEVRPRNGVPGTYSYLLEEAGTDDHGDLLAEATPLTVDAPAVEGAVESHGDVDVFTFTLTAGRIFQATCTLRTLQGCELVLRNLTGVQLTSGPKGVLAYEAPQGGMVVLEVKGTSVAALGGYALAVEDMGVDDHGDEAAQASPLAVDAPLSASLETPVDVDFFSFPAQAGHIYRVTVGSGGGPARLVQVLRGSSMVANGTTDSPAVLEAAEDGTLHLRVSGGSYNAELGGYTLLLQDLGTDDFGDDAASATPLTPGVERTGVLEVSGDDDVFSAVLTAGVAYQVSFSRSHYSAELSLSAPSGEAVYLQSGTLRPAVSGTYLFRVESRWGGYHGVTYALKVQ